MFANRFTAIIDACVLASVARRDLILSLAKAELFRLRWTGQILSETESAIVNILMKRDFLKPEAAERAGRAVANIRTAFPEANVMGHDELASALAGLPDPRDRHVVAAAIHCKASVIVTDNLKDFPAEVLSQYEIEPKSADDFIADAIDLDYERSIKAIRGLRERLQNPALTGPEILERWRDQKLVQTAQLLNPHLDKL